jgi:hypothetical protein
LVHGRATSSRQPSMLYTEQKSMCSGTLAPPDRLFT